MIMDLHLQEQQKAQAQRFAQLAVQQLPLQQIWPRRAPQRSEAQLI